MFRRPFEFIAERPLLFSALLSVGGTLLLSAGRHEFTPLVVWLIGLPYAECCGCCKEECCGDVERCRRERCPRRDV